ncbi:MAG TPA: hypothetical protein DET40_25505 [Lentisphaeria bacterium]|nr:MAG: hypothetical protein A2X45_18460 [Lentisphaerae bacterium GWF2_50_93]HCE46918.1 hypothetical protein [Lentisphaeria bacterium]
MEKDISLDLEPMHKSEKLKKHLLEMIREKNLKAGDEFYSDREIAGISKVSLATVHKITSSLVSDGVLFRKQGIGTFVADNSPKLDIGVVLESFDSESNIYYKKILGGINTAIEGFSCMKRLYSLENMPIDIFHNLLAQRKNEVKGLIWTSLYYDQMVKLENTVGTLPFPVMVLNRKSEKLDYVGIDFTAATLRALKEFASNGHKEIALVGSRTSGWPYLNERYEAFSSFMAKSGVSAEDMLIETNGDAAYAFGSTLEFLKRRKPTAMLIAGIRFFSGTYQAIQTAGLKVPEDISLIVFDELTGGDAALFPGKVSCIKQPLEEMGRRAAFELLLKITGKKNDKVSVMLDVDFCKGETIRKLK